jgi:hypothetical protein
MLHGTNIQKYVVVVPVDLDDWADSLELDSIRYDGEHVRRLKSCQFAHNLDVELFEVFQISLNQMQVEKLNLDAKVLNVSIIQSYHLISIQINPR